MTADKVNLPVVCPWCGATQWRLVLKSSRGEAYMVVCAAMQPDEDMPRECGYSMTYKDFALLAFTAALLEMEP